MAFARRRSTGARRSRASTAGQSVVEFSVIVPIMLFMVVAIADFGRLYTSAVAIESAAREAADYGAFSTSHWMSVNSATTSAEMERRACVAAAGSHLEGYATTDPTNHRTCTNPTFTCTLEWQGTVAPCAASGGSVGGADCSDSMTDPACTVHVRLVYEFRTILGLPPLPSTVQIDRDSRFRVSDLAPP